MTSTAGTASSLRVRPTVFGWPTSSPSLVVSRSAISCAAQRHWPQTPLLPRMLGSWLTGCAAAK